MNPITPDDPKPEEVPSPELPPEVRTVESASAYDRSGRPWEAVLPVFFGEDGRLRSMWRFVIAAIAVVAANVVGGMLSAIIFRGHPLAFDAGYRLFSVLLLIGIFAFMLRHVDQVEGSVLGAQGLGFGRGWLRDAVIGIALGFVMVTLAVIAIGIWGDLEFAVNINPATVRHSVTVLVLLVAGAALEEVMFRGYPFQRLVESIGAWGAIIVLSVLFGAVHLGNPNSAGIASWGFFNTIAVGVLFAWAYLKTRSLWLPIGLHFAWNFTLGFVYGLPVSGLQMFSTMVRGKATGPKLLTGGAYGIEASVTGAAVILLGMAIILVMPKRAPFAPPDGAGGMNDNSVEDTAMGI